MSATDHRGGGGHGEHRTSGSGSSSSSSSKHHSSSSHRDSQRSRSASSTAPPAAQYYSHQQQQQHHQQQDASRHRSSGGGSGQGQHGRQAAPGQYSTQQQPMGGRSSHAGFAPAAHAVGMTQPAARAARAAPAPVAPTTGQMRSGHIELDSLYGGGGGPMTVNSMNAPNNSTLQCGCENIDCPFCNQMMSIQMKDQQY